MSTFLDLITSVVVFGILAVTVGRIQSNINVSMYQNQFNVVVQTNAVELARQIEWDFAKIGHHVTGQKVLYAGASEIRYSADIDNDNVIHTIRYYSGDSSQCLSTSNRYDFPLFRIQDGRTLQQNWGLTSIKFSYFDDANKEIPAPITVASDLARIHSISASFRLQSAEPVVSPQDTTWSEVSWEKTIVPRNLGDLTY